MDTLGIPQECVLMPKTPHAFWGTRVWFDLTVDAGDGFLRKHFAAQ
jgi:hypothetical protein